MTTEQGREAHEKIERARQVATVAVATFENLPIGEAFAPVEAIAAAAVAELCGHARAALFPQSITRVEPAVFHMADHVLDESAGPLDRIVADAHARSLRTYPEFASFLRTPIGIGRVRAYGLRRALIAGHRGDHESIVNMVNALEGSLAAQLGGIEEFEPAASVLSSDVPTLTQRIVASKALREQFARTEAERLTAEREVADRAICQAEINMRNELRSFFSARGQRVFNLPNGRVAAGAAVAAFASGSAAYDLNGDIMPAALDLAALEQVRIQTEAAEAAVQAHR